VAEAAFAAALAAFGLVAGYLIADRFHPRQKLVGWAMGLGAGVLFAVVAYALVEETIEKAQGPSLVGAGMAAGALVFFCGSRWLDQRFSPGPAAEDDGESGLPLALGAVLDGLPESMVIGISAALTGAISTPLVIAAFIANTAESMAGTPDLESAGMSRKTVLMIWLAILAASVCTALIGYRAISDLSKNEGAIFNGFAAGALIMLLSTTLIPEGYEKGDQVAGLMVVLGFSLGFALEHFE
jgi:zinc transporter, ZIP family